MPGDRHERPGDPWSLLRGRVSGWIQSTRHGSLRYPGLHCRYERRGGTAARASLAGTDLREKIYMADPTEELREKVRVLWWILGMGGMVDEILGHVSARVAGGDEMWIPCRSPEEEGVRHTTVDAIRRVDFDGKGPPRGE